MKVVDRVECRATVASSEFRPVGPEEGFERGAWRDALRLDMSRELDDPRWPQALISVATIHLAAFLLCQYLSEPISRADLRFPAIWFAEAIAAFGAIRLAAGRVWLRRSAATTLVIKLWTTFLILSLNVLTLNSLLGIEQPWFKPVWATLSTFLFASLAWLFTPLFFIVAVQMWATGMLMVQFPDHAYLTYGLSWWLALIGVALRIRGRVSEPMESTSR